MTESQQLNKTSAQKGFPAAEKMEICPCVMCSQRLISHYPLSLISASPCLPDAADT